MRITIEVLKASVNSNKFVSELLYLAGTEFDPYRYNDETKSLAPIDYSFNTKLEGVDTRVRIKLEL